MRACPDGRDQEELFGTAAGGDSCVCQLGVEIDLTKSLARARLPHGSAESTEDVSAREFRKRRQALEVHFDLPQLRMLEIEGAANKRQHLMVIRGLQKEWQAMAPDQTGSPCKHRDTGRGPC